MPVGVVAGQPGALQRQHDPGLAQPDVGDQVGKALAAVGGGAGQAQVVIDTTIWCSPSPADGAPGQVVLPEQALGVRTVWASWTGGRRYKRRVAGGWPPA